MQLILKLYSIFLQVLDVITPLVMLIVRLWISRVFWASGVLAIAEWDKTLYLFTNEFPVPFLPPLLAAISATFFEIMCPLLLTLGLAARLATLPLLAITAVINFTYDQNPEHAYWALLLGVILCYGPGKWSVDRLIAKKIYKP